jgi:F-type H+-transporting ATPase subunit gamma
MSNLKEVRNRIASVKSTQQITSAMKMVAASKLRKAQQAVLQLRPYATKLQEILRDVSTTLENTGDDVYADKREVKRILFVPFVSNRGLCGAFNSNIIKVTNEQIKKYGDTLKESHQSIYTVGKYATEYYKRTTQGVEQSFDHLYNDLSFDNVMTLGQRLMLEYKEGRFDLIILIYNQFKNAAVQQLVVEQFLPVAAEEVTQKDIKTHAVDYLFEPSKERILTELVPKTLRIQFYKAILDSFASEQGARMTAMHQATDNADDLLKELRLSYNKARQAAITKELLEIITASEALKG